MGQCVETRVAVKTYTLLARIQLENMKTHVDDVEEDSGHASQSEEETDIKNEDKIPANDSYKMIIVWPNIIKFIILHSLALYGLTLLPSLSWQSWLFLLATYQFSVCRNNCWSSQ